MMLGSSVWSLGSPISINTSFHSVLTNLHSNIHKTNALDTTGIFNTSGQSICFFLNTKAKDQIYVNFPILFELFCL